jgi:hypothetical protein
LLIAQDATAGTASLVLIPSRLVTQFPGFGDGVFGDALKLGGPQLAADTLANKLEVQVDDTWVLTRDGLETLVDAVGPVSVDVDVDVKPTTGGDGTPVLSPGVQQLGGEAASGFALFGVPEENELDRVARLQLVLDGVLDKLPATAQEIAAQLPTGDASKSTDPARVAEALRLLGAARRAGSLNYVALPVLDIDTGSDTKNYRLDQKGVAALQAGDLAGSVPPNEWRPENRVVVRNGVGTAGLGQSVTRRLNTGGFVVVESGNADEFGFAQTVVEVFDSGERAMAAGRAVAALLGMSDEVVEVSNVEQSVADVIVTVGADYKP